MLAGLKKEVFYPYSPLHVWQVLTNREALAAWLMENDFEARIGHKFKFICSSPIPGMDESINCEVIELDEPRRLSFTWKDSLMCQSSIVTWTLEAVDDGTVLRLEHRIIETAFTDLKPVYLQGNQEHYNRYTDTSSPSATLSRQLGVSTLTDYGYRLKSYGFEQPTSIILSSYLNGGWEYKLNQNLPLAIRNRVSS